MEEGHKAATTDCAEDAESEECLVKERCQEHREALPGEPRCVICGRYGEYICDQTDDDICSIECKKILLAKHEETGNPSSISIPAGKIPTVDECFYVEDNEKDESGGQTSIQIESLRSKIELCIKGVSVPAPGLSFSSCNLLEALERNLETAGYLIPTPVQMQAIPAALNRGSLLVSADTGSGKIASFLVPDLMFPIISHTESTMSSKNLRAKTVRREPFAKTRHADAIT